MPELPARPSREHLRKEAKRFARDRGVPLAAAQHRIAGAYGFANWAQLVAHVAQVRGEQSAVSPLFAAVRARDVDGVRRLLAQGVNPRRTDGRETPLHAAARRGPLAVVETLIAGGALAWQPDARGRTALDAARRGRGRERAAIVALLDRTAIGDPGFRAAVDALQRGDVAALAACLDARPELLHERITGPDVYRAVRRHQYFLEPKLFWFIANNPKTVERLPECIGEIAQLMIDRGVEQSDLDYALELTLTSAAAREAGQQLPLVRRLLAAGAQASPQTAILTAGYGELDALRALLEAGTPLDAPLAAACGANAALRELLPSATPPAIAAAFGLAVLNGRLEAVRLTLAAGADVNAFLPVHTHSTALHQAALDDNLALIDILLAAGARSDRRDTLWDATPVEWAAHEGRSAARALLERRAAEAGGSAAAAQRAV